LRVLHDVPLVDEGHGLASIPNGVADRLSNEALRTRLADRLHADAAVRPHLRLELLLQDLDHADRLGRSFFPFDARVDVLRSLAEDDHVEALRMRHGTGHPGNPIDGPHVRVQVEGLPEGTFRDRNPPPTGVVIGPLIATTYSRIAARVACGKSSPY